MLTDFDDPIEDLNYIILRLRKYIRKTKYWITLEELSDKEMNEIALYNRRIRDFLEELQIEFSNDYEKRDAYRGGYGLTPIFDFADDPKKISKENADFATLWQGIDELIKVAESLVEDFTFDELQKKYRSRRGTTLFLGDHRAHKNRRQSNRIEFTVDDALKAAIEKEVENSGVKKAEWLRDAVRLNLSVHNRRLLYDMVK